MYSIKGDYKTLGVKHEHMPCHGFEEGLSKE